ncbi:MAG TPA: transglutaminase family protein [Methylophilaceae bacterium]|nr:transglutaminase family protein [Methylophilaceae bacterium]
MLLNIEHHTHYTYSEPVNYTIQQLRLTPQEGYGQHVGRWDIRVNGNLQESADTFGNVTHTLVVDGEHGEINIMAYGEVETGLIAPLVDNALPLPIYLRSTPLTAADEHLRKFSAKFATSADNTKMLHDLMHAIIKRVPYVKGSTEVETTAATAFELGKGVCQDHAHIFIACCRELGLPSRYVSGYLFTEDGSLMVSHACVDVWLENSGWKTFDVSNCCETNGKHVRLAVGLDYRDACPVSGTRVGGGKETMKVSVKVSQMQQSQQ